jgi:competence protein ComEC
VLVNLPLAGRSSNLVNRLVGPKIRRFLACSDRVLGNTIAIVLAMAHLRTQSTLSLERQPFFYISAVFVAGILIDRLAGPPRWIPLCLTLAFVGTATAFVIRRYVAATALLLIAFGSSGMLASSVQRLSVGPERLTRLYDSQKITPDDPVELIGVLIRPPEPIPDGRLIDVATERVVSKQQEFTASGKVRLMVSLPDDDVLAEFSPLGLGYGSRVRILVRLARAQTYGNPGSVDFNEFLERRGYDLKGTIKSPLLIETVGRERVNPILNALYRIRLRVMTALDSHFQARESGTLKAMLVGNRYFLDQTTVRRLREAGTFHMLVIAGLHVGIIAWLLLAGTSGTRSGIKPRHLARVIFALVVLWAYAVMVGMAPPVTRTTLMITIGLIGPILFRRSISLNSVAVAAFVMLAIDPALIGDAGFQLSFAAVCGIVLLALPVSEKLREIGQWRPSAEAPHPPRCSNWLKSLSEFLFWSERDFQRENQRAQIRYSLDKLSLARLLDRWHLQPAIRYSAVLIITSAAIQLSTLPLMIFYFNRVSPVGLLINIVAGLLTGALMIGSAATIAVGPVSAGLASILARGVTEVHYLLVNSIAPFSHIPGATFRAAQYNGGKAAIYFVYFIPLGIFAYLLDEWRPVDKVLQVARGHIETGTINAPLSNQAIIKEPSEETGHPVRKGLSERLTGVFGAVPMRKRNRTLAQISAVMLIGCVFLIMRPFGSAEKGELTINFLDVGQGDSALVIFPHGSTMLIDAGGEIHINSKPKGARTRPTPSEADMALPSIEDDPDIETDFNDTGFTIGEAVVSRFLWSLGLSRLDYVLATHAHSDHTGGLTDVFQDFRVGELIVGHAPASDGTFRRLKRSAAHASVSIGTVSQGEGFEMDGVKIEVLWPQSPQADGSGKPPTSGNNDSVVLRLSYGSVNVIMTGDIEQGAEQSLAASGIDLHADLVKVPHHGSKTSSTDAFLDRVQPKYAVVSVGVRSRFGHPNKEVVDRYAQRGIKLYWTGRDGMVTAKTDGTTISITNYLESGTANPDQ